MNIQLQQSDVMESIKDITREFRFGRNRVHYKIGYYTDDGNGKNDEKFVRVYVRFHPVLKEVELTVDSGVNILENYLSEEDMYQWVEELIICAEYKLKEYFQEVEKDYHLQRLVNHYKLHNKNS